MRVALCFFGFMRTYKICYPSFLERIVNAFDADVFLYAPSITNDDNQTIVTMEEIQNIYKNKLIKCELYNYSIEFLKEEVKKMNIPEWSKWNAWEKEAWKIISMFYHMKKVVEFKDEYELNNNFKYDIVFLARPDIEILTAIDINYDMNKIYYDEVHISPVHGSDPGLYIGDHLFMSKSENISLFKEIYDIIPQFSKDGIVVNNETIIGFFFKKRNIEVIHNTFMAHRQIK
jgi:hypothetical protein